MINDTNYEKNGMEIPIDAWILRRVVVCDR